MILHDTIKHFSFQGYGLTRVVKSAIRQFHFLKEKPYDKALVNFMKGFEKLVNRYYEECLDLEDASRFIDRLRTSYHDIKDMDSYRWLRDNHDLRLAFMVEGDRAEIDLQNRRDRRNRDRSDWNSGQGRRSRSRSPVRHDRRGGYSGGYRGRGNWRQVSMKGGRVSFHGKGGHEASNVRRDHHDRLSTRSQSGSEDGQSAGGRKLTREEELAKRDREREERHNQRDRMERKKIEFPTPTHGEDENQPKASDVEVTVKESSDGRGSVREIKDSSMDALPPPTSPADVVDVNNDETFEDQEMLSDEDEVDEKKGSVHSRLDLKKQPVHQRLGSVESPWLDKDGEPLSGGGKGGKSGQNQGGYKRNY